MLLSDERLDIEEFREALAEVKRVKGWTWEEISQMSGYSKGRITGVMFDKRLKTISKEWATCFFRSMLSQNQILREPMRREYDPF